MVEVKGGNKLEAQLKKMSASVDKAATLDVGFLAGSTESDGTSTPLVAALNEFGTGTMPPRPFFRNAIADNKDKWGPNLGTALVKTNFQADRALALLGESIIGQIQDSINKLTSPPLAASTIQRKGFEKPLIEHGDMLRSVDKRVT